MEKMRKTTKGTMLIVTVVLCVWSTGSQAVTSYIGDVDGFGYGMAAGYLGADGNPANRTPGILGQGDVLPDLNGDGWVATGAGDDFDYRSGAEAADPYAKWTDVALSTSYDKRPGLAEDAVFTFNFTVPSPGDPDYGQEHFVNFVYGDYDVNPMHATVEGAHVTLLGNSDGGGLDGYIWRAYSPVLWSDMLDGSVTIEIIAPNEPYVTFDYALLDTKPIEPPIPAPGAICLGGIGIGLVGWLRRRSAL